MTLLRHLGAGLALGALTGVEARGFMRLLTDEPEFSWGGTAFIVGIFAVAGLALAAAYDMKLRGRSRWWKLLALPAILTVLGQGMLLLPGVLGVGLAMSRRRWRRIVGVLLLVAYPVAVPAALGAFGELPTPRFAAGLAAVVVCCAAMAAGVRAAFIGWSAPADAPDTFRPIGHESPEPAPGSS